MSEIQVPVSGKQNRRVTSSAMVAALVLVLGSLGLYAGESYFHMILDKPPAPLTKPLSDLPAILGRFTRKEEPDRTLSESIVEGLGTKDYLLRTYIDSDPVPAGHQPWEVSINLNYYPTGDATPHVPENCWVGNGREIAKTDVFKIPGVKRKDGSEINLEMKLLSFVPTSEEVKQVGGTGNAEGLYRNVAYVFHVNGVYEVDKVAVTSRFWNATNKYAYHAKIEVTMERLCTREDAQKVISDFMQDSLAEIEKCLPDPKILTEGLPAATMPAQTK